MADQRSPSGIATFSRGTALWWQQAKLLTSAIVAVVIGAILVGAIAGALYVYFVTSAESRYLAVKHVEAEILTVVPMANPNVSFHLGNDDTELPPAAALSFTQDAADEFFVYVRNAVLYAVLTAIAVMFLSVLFWMEYGRGKLTDKQVRGAKLVKAKELVKELESRDDASPYRIAGVPMRKKAEVLGTLFSGAQGSGKSQQFFALMDQVRGRKKRAIVYDPSGEFTAAYYREGKDIILNPLDARSPNWNVWREIQSEIHYEGLAEGLIPIPPNVPDPFFAIAGRMVFKGAVRALGDDNKRTNAALYKAIAHSNLEELHAILANESAATYVDPVTERTGMSLKMTVQNQLDCFRFLHDEGEPFSIREWIQNEDEDDDSWLFITVNEEQKTALLPLVSLWCDVAIRALLTLKPIHRERLWVFYDELPTLQKLEIMKLATTNIRKYGGCLVIGIQDYSLLFQIYGEHLARTIISGCQTKLLLRVTDGDAAKALANAIGQADLDEKEESLNLGIDERRDGMSVFARRNLRDLVLSSEILHLPDMEGYLVTPSDYPVARVKYDYVPHPEIVTPFIPRQTYDLWLPASVAAERQAAQTQHTAVLPSPPDSTAAVATAASPSPAPTDATATASPTARSVTAAGSAPNASNLVVLATGEVVDGDTGEVQGESAPRAPDASGRPGQSGLGDLLG
ncbi:traM recognition site of TraD and TraG family protein (plasmid) [Burkholderia cepacia]|uniref:type IV secretion system DNA-binding domain-containing protein n=1 Tax=Burkholderia cepacia TaxID=292 RepID=UPI00298F7AFA|nr:type IV secretion system DNA-binding domain-containing protein [Burkholderia cepacia]MDW9232969.1 traM recognition site of TraD and TraG family protein [Burkholderia cepacia]